MMQLQYLVWVVVLFTSSSQVLSETIIRRDGLAPIQCEIVSGGRSGLLIEVVDQAYATLRIPWSSIQSIEPNVPRPLLKKYLDSGEQLWRAMARFNRGDLNLAEPLFASQFKQLAGTDSSDTLIAAEGLLRILIARGAIEWAVHPWLEVVRLTELGFLSPYDSLESIIDEETGFCPHLPVMMVELNATNFLEEYLSSESKKVSKLASLLQCCVDGSFESYQIQFEEDNAFMALLIPSLSEVRLEREVLQEAMEDLLPWQKAWLFYLWAEMDLKEDSQQLRTNGLLHLVSVASMNASVQPWLSGAAMLRLSEELLQDGFVQQSTRIFEEAMRLFPSHPLVLDAKENKRNIY